jgi:hypothetical protein
VLIYAAPDRTDCETGGTRDSTHPDPLRKTLRTGEWGRAEEQTRVKKLYLSLLLEFELVFA